MNRLILSLILLAGIGAGNASAYSHSVVNRSKYTMRFWVNYKACSNDTWDVKPGQTLVWRSGLCCISDIHAKAEFGSGGTGNKPRIPDGAEDFFGRQVFDMIGMGGFFYLICQNSNWRLDGEPADQDGNPAVVSLQKL